ncbi:MAG: aldose 1-epimerase family protein [Lawsonibacter sp.]|jgi:galactose mutarotase-like enzyme
MSVCLENDILKVTIDELGAQLCSVRAHDGTEYIWQADPAIWGRHAPLLFPVIGRLAEGKYNLGTEGYSIPIHGFARDRVFTLEQPHAQQAVFCLTDDADTQAVYPFSFSLTVTYTLEHNRLIKTHRVENRSACDLFYELGGHDGYQLPLAPGESMSDYGVVVPGMNTLHPYGMNEQCMITPKQDCYPLEQGRIALTPSTYGLDTVILDELPQRRALLVDGSGCPRVTVDFPDFPYLGLWTPDKPFDTNFVCIEPWSALPDAVFAGRGLDEKPGIRRLSPGVTETLTYITTFHERRS